MKKQFDKKRKPSFGRSSDTRFEKSTFSDGKAPGRFKAICGKCGSSCEVPFKPSSVRPVLCHNCFKRDDVKESRLTPRFEGGKRFENDRTSRDSESPSSEHLQRQISIINSKLDKILSILEDLELDDED